VQTKQQELQKLKMKNEKSALAALVTAGLTEPASDNN
jgi:hypothetical protein